MDFGKDLEDYPKLQSKGWLLRVKNHRFCSGDTSDDDASANVFFTNTFPFCPNWFNWFWMSMTPLLMCEHSTRNTTAIITLILRQLCNDSKYITGLSPIVGNMYNHSSIFATAWHMELQIDYFILKANERGTCNFTAMFDCLKLLYLKYKGYNSNRFWWRHRRSDNYLDNASFPLLFFHDTQRTWNHQICWKRRIVICSKIFGCVDKWWKDK